MHAVAALHSYEVRLNAAATPGEYWAVVVQSLKEFGYQQAQLSITHTSFEWCCNPPSFKLWEVSIPTAEFDYIRLSRTIGMGAAANRFAPFIDIVRRSLTVKRGMFLSYTRAPEVEHVKAGG